MSTKEKLIQTTSELYETGCIDGIEGYDREELQKIADSDGNGCLVQGDRWTRTCHGYNLWDDNYSPNVGDLIYFDGCDGFAYYIVQEDDVEEEDSEEE